MQPTRRDFLATAGATTISLALPLHVSGSDSKFKKHIVTLSFDDGFKKSSIKTAEIYEKHKLSACINVADGRKLPVRWATDENVLWSVRLPGWGMVRRWYCRDSWQDRL